MAANVKPNKYEQMAIKDALLRRARADRGLSSMADDLLKANEKKQKAKRKKIIRSAIAIERKVRAGRTRRARREREMVDHLDGTNGPASTVRRIDPKTGEVIE